MSDQNNNAAAAPEQQQKQPAKGKEKKANPATAPVAHKEKFINTTPVGEKKNMNEPMRDTYSPMAVEAAWYDWWEHSGFFKADNTKTGPKFVIMLPPPNVTGSLHLGHTLTCSVQDCLTRWHRMNGENTLWLPGTDHAGIATQAVVEKKIMKERGLTKHDLGREAFVSEVWKWKEQYGNTICNQLRRTGASVDWSRFAFTMDDKLSRAVTEAFVRLFEDKTIYRDTRLVNWCCALKTAISNIEVEYIEVPKATKLSVPGYDKKIEFGVLTSFAYKVDGSDEEIVIATTRPETMLGDTAVAVHPDDPRYKHLHGKFLVHPFVDRKIPIITDPILVQMEFGTGAVKVTPAHDPNDFDCGKRNGLQFINILNDDGTLNHTAAQFAGMKRFDARYAVVKALEEKGLLRGKQDHSYTLAICSRSGDIIEPMIKPQWYCDCKQMAAESTKAVREGRLKILPEFHEKKWFSWLDNIHDWCISRQLWWGHRIPAYLVAIDGIKKDDELANWVVGRTYEEALENACKKFADVDRSRITLHQDEDVLDTWFSSGLFPFSTLGWPEKTPDLDAFYPGNLLETGHDILFFWVARMVMMGLKLTGQLPFTEVYLHAMVRDKQGRKMSKSLGNVINPIDVIEGITLEELHAQLNTGNLDPREIETAKKGQKEQFPEGIQECGADALRFALLAYTTQGRDINLDISRVVGYRNFCNKLWNATKFALTHLKDFVPSHSALPSKADNLSSADKWILHKLNKAIRNCIQGFKEYDFALLTTSIYSFWLYELCDVYLELVKGVMSSDQSIEENRRARTTAQFVLYTCVEQGLRLLHPTMPFVTEELWQRLPGRDTLPADRISIMINPYPAPVADWDDQTIEANMQLTLDVIHTIRSLKASYSLTNAQRPKVYIKCADQTSFDIVNAERGYIQALSFSGDIEALHTQDEVPTGCAVDFANENVAVNISLTGLIKPEDEIAKLEKKKEKLIQSNAALQKQMNSPHYAKVPDNVKEQNNQKLAAQNKEIEGIDKAIEGLKKMMI